MRCPNKYRLVHHAYCGMDVPYGEFEDRAEARSEAAKLVQLRRREGYPVTTLERGRQWEIQEPENCMMVPDECGVLALHKPTFAEEQQ
jgi:hypothetical protein